MNKVTFEGVPVPQGRPKFARHGQNVVAVDPAKSKAAKKFLEFQVRSVMKRDCVKKIPSEVPVMVKAEFVFPLPSSWSKAKKERMSGAFKTSKPDSDNLLKLVLDAFSKILWEDDSQVTVVGGVIKRYARYKRNTDKQEKPSTTFYWEELPLSIGD